MKRIRTGINFMMLVRVTGWLVMIEALFMCAPVALALVNDDADLLPFALSAAVTAGAGAAMTFAVRPTRFDMGKPEGFLLTVLVWVVFSAFGMIPFLLSKTPFGLTDAFFEAMSGFTTTGVTVATDVDSLSHPILLWRSMMQWLGGMGIILFTLAVLPMLNSSGGMQMFNAEVSGITHEKLRPRVSSTAKRLWLIYALLTGVLAALYAIGPMSLFDSVCHALSTMSTGGFSTHQESLAVWDNSLYVKVVTTVFMFIGSINFALIYKASTGHVGSMWQNEAFRTFVKLIGVYWVVFVVALALDPNVDNTWDNFTINPLFQVISAMSSTVYMVKGFEHWGNLPHILLVVMMFIGACAGSTSGGVKIDRVVCLWKNSVNELKRCIYPNHILPVNFNGRTVEPEVINKVGGFMAFYIGVIVVGVVVLAACGIAPMDGLWASMSCVSNTGAEVSIPGCIDSYAALPAVGKWTLTLLMLTGRLEIFTVLVLLLPGFWRK